MSTHVLRKTLGPSHWEYLLASIRLVCEGYIMESSYGWREVCVSALRESDPKKLIACIEQAITAIERRYAEWGSNPGTPDELSAIRKAISGLESLANEKLGTHSAVDVPIWLLGTKRELFNIHRRLHSLNPNRRG